MDMDQAFERFKGICAEVLPRIEAVKTEQDARLQIINRILTECLGWDFADLKTEPPSDNGYTDYLLSCEGIPTFIVEAKRTGTLLVATANPRFNTYKTGGPALRDAQDGLKQATNYCVDYGVEFASLTTGLVWIGFQPFIGNGRSYKEGKSYVFPNLDAIAENFATFFDLFSKAGISQRLYKTLIVKAEGVLVSEFEPLTAVNQNHNLRMLAKSSLAADLDPIFKEFFGALSGENDREMLLECFVESQESRQADAALEKIVRAISSNSARNFAVL